MKPILSLIALGTVLTLAGCERTQGVTRASAPLVEGVQNVFGGVNRSTRDEFQPGVPNPIIYQAAKDVLGFLPLISENPRTGIIQYGYGVPPGGSQAYRATVRIVGSRLDARSLQLSLESRNGPVSIETLRAVEESIFTRARQIRIASLGES